MSKRGRNDKKRWRLDCGRVVALIGWLRREGRGREAARRGGVRGSARTDGAEERKGEEGGRRGADRWGPYVSGCGNKRKEKRETGRCGKEEVGCLGRKVRRFPLFFSFPNLFQFKLFLSNSNQNS
jgi:hypothetical protein